MGEAERYLLRKVAERTARVVTLRIVVRLKSYGPCGGEGHGLKNIWQEICAQVRGEHWIMMWQMYEGQIRIFASDIVGNLPRDRQWLLWYLTDEPDPEDLSEVIRSSPNLDPIVTLITKRVLGEADCAKEPEVESYLTQGRD